MIPKVIHLCWFSGDPYPAEIKICLASWRRILPDYKIHTWSYDEAKALNCPYINEALEAKRWAFAGDAVRFYALYAEGGVYMDSDVFLYKRFDEFLPTRKDAFVTFNENYNEDFNQSVEVRDPDRCGVQAAFCIATRGSSFAKELYDYYAARHYTHADGSHDDTISPRIMCEMAKGKGWEYAEKVQDLGCLITYPTRYLAPKKKWPRLEETFARHCVYGSWRKRKLNRKIERFFKHLYLSARFALFRR